MPAKKKPRICGGCSSVDSVSWHRQRGNNKFFCQDCQVRKLTLKSLAAASANYRGENLEGENSTMNSSESSVELGENLEVRSPKMGESSGIGGIRKEISSDGQSPEQASIGHPKLAVFSVEERELTNFSGGDEKSENSLTGERKMSDLSPDPPPIDDGAISGYHGSHNPGIDIRNSATPMISQTSTTSDTIDQIPTMTSSDYEKSTALPTGHQESTIAMEIDQIDHSKSDQPESPPTNKNGESIDHEQKKHQKSPITHPRLTRLRSAASRPVRQAALASANKIQQSTSISSEKPEKQSHSRSSSAAGGNFSSSKSTGGSSVSLSAIGGSQLIVPRNKGRRHIFKLLKPEKSSSRRATVSTFPALWHKGQLFRQSDVVAVVDEKDESVYYATIRGLLRDEYCQQFAALTWLVPTNLAPVDRSFDPLTYMLGPEDESFYPLDSLEFICHLPDDYFKSRGSSASSVSTILSRSAAIASTSLNPKDQFVGMV